MDGDHLDAEDVKAVVDKLLAYHPHSEDKIGCGLHSIMVSFIKHIIRIYLKSFIRISLIYIIRENGL